MSFNACFTTTKYLAILKAEVSYDTDVMNRYDFKR